MFERLTNSVLETARHRIAELFDNHAEWFYTLSDGSSQALRRSELDINIAQNRLILSCWTEKGTRSWRIRGWNWTGEKLELQASRRMGAERPVISLIPRASASAIGATVRAARQVRCDQLAQLASGLLPGVKIERAKLSPGMRRGQPGRYARILLRLKHHRIAVTGSVAASKPSDVDAFLSSALLWFGRTGERARAPNVQQLWLLVENELVKALSVRIALLRASLRGAIAVYELDQAWTELSPVVCPGLEEIWKRRLARFRFISPPASSESAQAIIAHAPAAIDVVQQARHGETLRYFGLPFARVRRLMNSELVWFGIEGSRGRLLDEKSEHEWAVLLRNLDRHRSASASDHRHALYRTAGEAWLESLLRRDISKLDPGLIVAPLHAQFRTTRAGRLGSRPIDLLALRRDGRLVVIELKVSEDREHVLQGADYWQRVEAHRRRGHIWQARLFGERRISSESPLVYLVAPTLRVHPSFQTLARLIDPNVEVYRFDINEDWRAGVRVMRRKRVN
ncbi:MAG: hypothetical protein H0U18_08980 [Pyrinomonadaceae bacterium]|nr:hypothetical protein [Pyrinomonadaceae bacterium]